MIQAYFTYDRYSPGQYIIVNVNRINGAEFSESNQSLKNVSYDERFHFSI